jgi:hypothetical protein
MIDEHNGLYNEIDALFAPFKIRRLSSKEIAVYKRNDCNIGWLIKTEINFEGAAVFLALLVKKSYPFSRPLLYIHTPKLKPLSFPHIENDGKLCVWSDRVIPNLTDSAYLLEIIREAINLLDSNFNGVNEDHFRDEFLSYWLYHSQKKSYYVTTICDPENRKSREVYVYRHGLKNFLFADSYDDLELWLDNRSLLPPQNRKKKRKKKLQNIQLAALFAIETPWIPKDYPMTCGQLYDHLSSQVGLLDAEILHLISTTLRNPVVEKPSCILSINSPSGYCYAGIVFEQSIFVKSNHRSIRDGYRNQIPERAFRSRFANLKIYGASATRIDPSWVNGRDSDTASAELRRCSNIIIIGCGSVGSSIVRLLVQSGVEKLILIDGDFLETSNISRHDLGYSSVGKNKAEALASSLAKEYPTLKVKAVSQSWQDAIYSKGDLLGVFRDAELIVSCTGDWYSDQGLLEIQSKNKIGVIVFSFTEAHAMAGHVVVNSTDSGAFNSLHHTSGSKVGKMLTPVTQWTGETYKKIPACGGTFQPYGIVPLTYLHALTTEIILELLLGDLEPEPTWYVVFGSKKKLQKFHGEWSSDWCKKYGDPGAGRFSIGHSYENSVWVKKSD